MFVCPSVKTIYLVVTWYLHVIARFKLKFISNIQIYDPLDWRIEKRFIVFAAFRMKFVAYFPWMLWILAMQIKKKIRKVKIYRYFIEKTLSFHTKYVHTVAKLSFSSFISCTTILKLVRNTRYSWPTSTWPVFLHTHICISFIIKVIKRKNTY